MSDAIETVPVREGIFRETAEGAVLIGQRCTACGQIHFPAVSLCQSCLSDQLEPVDLSPEGELFCATTVHMKTAHFDPPYTVGYVALPEGLKVFAPLVAPPGEPLPVGTRLKLELAPMWQEDGKSVVAYRFRPV